VKHPHRGALYDSGIDRLAGMRRVPVTGFEYYLIFYLPHEGGIDVIRVLHGARDLDSLFDQEEAGSSEDTEQQRNVRTPQRTPD
jgi:toxin ParE1/3/4